MELSMIPCLGHCTALCMCGEVQQDVHPDHTPFAQNPPGRHCAEVKLATTDHTPFCNRCAILATQTLATRIGCPCALCPRTFVRIMAAPSATRRRASPRSRQPHTNGTLKLCLLMWWISSAGVSTCRTQAKQGWRVLAKHHVMI